MGTSNLIAQIECLVEHLLHRKEHIAIHRGGISTEDVFMSRGDDKAFPSHPRLPNKQPERKSQRSQEIEGWGEEYPSDKIVDFDYLDMFFVPWEPFPRALQAAKFAALPFSFVITSVIHSSQKEVVRLLLLF